MIQGGGYDASYDQRKTRAPIAIESANGLKNDRGTIAMARTSDPNSATSQFFINHGDNEFLNHPGQAGYGYAVFGKVSSGMDRSEEHTSELQSLMRKSYAVFHMTKKKQTI